MKLLFLTALLLVTACATSSPQPQNIIYKDKTYIFAKTHTPTTETYNFNYDLTGELFTSSAEITEAADHFEMEAESNMKKTCGKRKPVKTSGPNIVSSQDLKYTGQSKDASARGLGLLFFAVDDSIWFEYKCD